MPKVVSYVRRRIHVSYEEEDTCVIRKLPKVVSYVSKYVCVCVCMHTHTHTHTYTNTRTHTPRSPRSRHSARAWCWFKKKKHTHTEISSKVSALNRCMVLVLFLSSSLSVCRTTPYIHIFIHLFIYFTFVSSVTC